ncbi:hypothetical protein ACWCOP_07630 [Maricaulaceae bacterium MS644]
MTTFTVLLSGLLLGAAQPAEEPGLTTYLDANPAEYAQRAHCVDPLRAHDHRRFEEPVFEDRFVWADYSRTQSLLVVYRRSCGALMNSTPVPRCENDRVNTRGYSCSAQALYLVPDEAAGRALALTLLVEEARGDGVDLPASNLEAASALINRVQATH